MPLPRLQHTFKDDGAFYFSTELVPGVSMSQLTEEQKQVVTEELLEVHSRFWKHHTCWQPKSDIEKGSYVFCHNDLGQHNVIVDPETLKINAIIDWEYGGFWPEWFEQPYWKRKGPSAPLRGEEDDRERCREWLITLNGKVPPSTDPAGSGVVVEGAETLNPNNAGDGSLIPGSFVRLVITFAVPFILAYVAHTHKREQQQLQQIRDEVRHFIRTFESVSPINERIREGVDEVQRRYVRGHAPVYRADDPDVTPDKLKEVAQEATQTYLEGRYRSVIRTRVYAHLGQKDYKEVVDLIRQQIISAAGINEEATKIIDEDDAKGSARASEDCGDGEN
ncbi:hypothetical protein QBC33DRAFT_572087 [Phialemonium atrogriseum]|uniref:Aminoglycoside phosphotransferase domain-containing protein n=1 Tax=Phialemonium atrogriseum TaxID=1093897 RepID=A0AAJ0BV90_9PEZI|nr:uncharacterized protein QBC33DRAFT_572087 [Phialemonium atrogriseum]KAK1765114.1 hypothetical protein QBC33DRAFT_572087 [Phialemonium atrogriseum]